MMTIDYRFDDLDAHGVTIRAQAMALEAEHQAIIGDVLAAGDLWGGAFSEVLPTVHRRPGAAISRWSTSRPTLMAPGCRPPAGHVPPVRAPQPLRGRYGPNDHYR